MIELQKLKSELKDLNKQAAGIREIAPELRAEFGKKINEKRNEILEKIALEEKRLLDTEVTELDVTAWSNVNEPIPEFYPAEMGSAHPLMTELDRVTEIYQMMGFDIMEARQLDDE